LAGPKTHDEGLIELEDFFWRQRPYFYGAILVCLILSMFANVDYLKTPNAALFFKQNLTVLPMLIPTILGLVSRSRWVQWIAGLCFLAMVITYTVLFCSTLA
jgi:hypothetical protein